VRYLLDSHALLWLVTGARFDRATRRRIERGLVIVSAVTPWELGDKRVIGKLRFERPLSEEIENAGFGSLGITIEHAERAGRLPLHHRDPFDRMLIAQAQVEHMTIVTRDDIFDAYDVDVLHC
jgi:PIN domain nuclease of toxin-antitoxin system